MSRDDYPGGLSRQKSRECLLFKTWRREVSAMGERAFGDWGKSLRGRPLKSYALAGKKRNFLQHSSIAIHSLLTWPMSNHHADNEQFFLLNFPKNLDR